MGCRNFLCIRCKERAIQAKMPKRGLSPDPQGQLCSFARRASSSLPPNKQGLAVQIGLLKNALQKAGLPLYLAPYGVLPTAYECGIIEV